MVRRSRNAKLSKSPALTSRFVYCRAEKHQLRGEMRDVSNTNEHHLARPSCFKQFGGQLRLPVWTRLWRPKPRCIAPR